MPQMMWIPRPWEAQPLKRRRITVDDLEQGFLKLSLSGGLENVELDALLETLTLTSLSTSHSASEPDADLQDELHRTGSPPADVVVEDLPTAAEPSVWCTEIVPFRKPPRRRRMPRLSASIPKPMSSMLSFAKFAVDSEGTAFVLPEAVREQLAQARREYKRRRDASAILQANSPAAIVVYDKPRKHDVVEDFCRLRL
mmetsp:Transcript_52229/g.93692  ORF Transcript_52229/g.93692 Transcript_52229/m.93692 type:complete len:198 (-) Transcript_52229:141-734(-)|eukprot:CAMPEP_0197651022 /NCGR_PEP_ID=MMETSP1338-20131121/31305_1 /TAXON_ID=43686 ORGANISM="Pelagodinium beii, Strain RCC1491" /NCGR_SAMPLE_ID=MMETSP1338 /ASSEMBLY_ACC=CAM_ASM_000754 /LENGTH=197 /DNA_ID=CAMNT_0043225561 /DNA_START=68 /DNA_END=661 /DNA_ORIENTATION=+